MSRHSRRYREARQGPMLGRAGEIFAELTRSSFERLVVDYSLAEILKKKLTVHQVLIDRPQIHLQVQEGRNQNSKERTYCCEWRRNSQIRKKHIRSGCSGCGCAQGS